MSGDGARAAAADHAVDRAEQRWVLLSSGLIGLLLALLVFTGLHWAAAPPSGIEPIDPRTLHIAGEFIEADLGSRPEPDGTVSLRMISQQYAFNPACVIVPAGRRIRFRGTSADVVHGFLITGTNANAMLIPGYITTFSTVFDRPGDRLMPCHEFCGSGHAAMWAHVRVLPAGEFDRLAGTPAGSRCD